jgi:hypothetical protein
MESIDQLLYWLSYPGRGIQTVFSYAQSDINFKRTSVHFDGILYAQMLLIEGNFITEENVTH